MKLDILNHFRSVLGDGTLVFNQGGIDVYKWPDPDDGESIVLATVGTEGPMQSPIGRKHRDSASVIAIMMFCEPPDVEVVAQLLVDITDYPKRLKTSIHWWHVLPLGRPVMPKSQLTHLIFLPPPFSSEFATFESKGDRIDVVWAVPISDGERAIFESEGTETLEQKLEINNVDVSNLTRNSIV